jgi:hypothetical protein
MSNAGDIQGPSRRFLIVNGFHPELTYVPLGSFGLCDYLNRKGVRTRIFNASLYPYEMHLSVLESTLREFEPDCVGIVIHWKELLDSALFLSFFIRTKFPEITVVAGGITAGFLGEELLRRYEHIDFIVIGDAERPLELLLRGEDASGIPNLIYRGPNGIERNQRWVADRALLDKISFTDVTCLIDYEKYLARINETGFPRPLGFPIMIGRGCAYDCPYCGGSKRAFRLHSGRRGVVLRSIDSILADLRKLTQFTDCIYICHEASPPHIRKLFEAIISDDRVARKFRCMYGSWHLMDARLLDIYAKAFKFEPQRKSIIEISPETTIDEDRSVVRDQHLFFSNQQLIECIRAIRHALSDSVEIHLFYSRYHSTQTEEKLITELDNIHRLRAYIYEQGWENDVIVFYLDLSTDPGSHYWERRFDEIPEVDAIDLLLREIKVQKMPTPSIRIGDNLAVFRPDNVSQPFVSRYTDLVHAIRLFVLNAPLFYHNLTRTIGFRLFREILEKIISEDRDSLRPTSRGFSRSLDLVHAKIAEEYESLYAVQRAFFDGLLMVCRTSLQLCASGPYAGSGEIVEASTVEGRPLVYATKPILDEERICSAEYDYISRLPSRPEEVPLETLKERPSLYVSCLEQIYRFDRGRYFPFFEAFDGSNTLSDIIHQVSDSRQLTADERRFLSTFLSEKHYFFTK